DLCQYPVFPWIIADYTSKTLNFDDPKTFRKLHLPMGVQKEEKIAIMQEKYKMSHSEDMPGFHWGSHYSSAGIITYYLIRLEPFTTYSRILQGGFFDHADRLFDDVGKTY